MYGCSRRNYQGMRHPQPKRVRHEPSHAQFSPTNEFHEKGMHIPLRQRPSTHHMIPVHPSIIILLMSIVHGGRVARSVTCSINETLRAVGHCHGDAARVCFRMKRGARTFGVFDNLYSPFMLVEDADARPATVAAMASRIIIEDVQRTIKQLDAGHRGVITAPSGAS